MSAPHRDTAKTVTIAGKIYPLGGQVERSQLGIFPRRFTQGDAQFDSDDYQSAQIYSNFSGGIGIEDSDEGADATRFWFGICDSRSPRMLALPPLVTQTKPAGASGTARPLGVIGSQAYTCFGTGAFAWNDTGSAWHTTNNNLDFAPVNKPVNFDGRVWIPQGANGIRSVTETTAATGTLTEANITATPEAAGLAIWNNKLYAIATDGDLWVLPQGSTTWAAVANSAGVQLRVNTGETPKNLVSYFNRAGEPTLWLVTTGAAYQFYETAVEWRQSNIKFPPHQDNGRSACVWRTGEDLWITNGMDIVRQTTGNAIVPLGSGISRDQGVPQEYRGTIHDIEPEISQLFALAGGSSGAALPWTYNDEVGAAGTGNGQFDDVRGLSVDSTGNVFACDENNERVQEFDSGLTYVAQFGSAGTGNGQFASNDGPFDCAHDSADALFVVDRGNSRIQKFSAANAYVSQFGTFDDGTPAVAASETWTLLNTFGTTGTGNNNYDTPAQVAVDSSGNTYTADTANNRIIKRNSSGTYVSQIALGGPAYGVAVDSSGNIYTTEDSNPDVTSGVFGAIARRKFNSAGVQQWVVSSAASGIRLRHISTDGTHSYVSAGGAQDAILKRLCSDGTGTTFLGSFGTGNGQFDTPYGIATDGTSLYVVDVGNSRVQQLTTAGVYVSQWAISANARGCAIDSAGRVLVAEFGSDVVKRYSSTGALIDSFAQADPDGVAVHTDGTVWVTNATSDNLTEWELVVVTPVAAIPPATGTFNLPTSIAIKQSNGRIYVVDHGNHRVQYFTSAGVYEGVFGVGNTLYSASTGAITAGSADGQFSFAGTTGGIAVNQTSGDVYVVDRGNDRIQQFTATGTFIRKWGSSGSGDGQFQDASAIAVQPTTGNVFVTDLTSDTVQEFTATGSFVRKFGSTGSGAGQFQGAGGLAFNAAGDQLYVSDATDELIQEFIATVGPVATAYPTLHAWPGTGWHCLWAGSDNSDVPTWAMVSAATAHYRLWWGTDDGNAYYLTLFRGFENVNQARAAGTAFFAASGTLLTSKFDAGMMGFPKLASHVVLFPVVDSITSTETILVEFSLDDGGWESLGTVNATTLGSSEKVTLSFGATGRTFNSIRFRLTMARGSASASPMLRGMCFLFNKIPQPARSFVFTILPTGTDTEGEGIGRNGQIMFSELDALADSHQFFTVVYGNQTIEHCRFAGSTGQDNTADLGGKRVVSIIELPTGAS